MGQKLFNYTKDLINGEVTITYEIFTVIGGVLLAVGGIILGKLFTERGSIQLYEALATALEGIRDTQASIPPPEEPPEHEPIDPDIPRGHHPNVDDGPSLPYSSSLDRVSRGLRGEISTVQGRNTSDLIFGMLLIIAGIILLLSPNLMTILQNLE